MSLETSWEMNNQMQVMVWITESSEIIMLSSAGCTLLYSTGRSGHTTRALGHLWLTAAPVRAGLSAPHGAKRDSAAPNSLTPWNYFCVQEHAQLHITASPTKMHFKAVPASEQVPDGVRGWGTTEQGPHQAKTSSVSTNWLLSRCLLAVPPGS